MKIKTLIAGAVCTGLALTLGISPIGVRGAMEIDAANKVIQARQEEAATRLSRAEMSLVTTVSELNAARVSTVSYADLEAIQNTFIGLGYKIEDVTDILPMDNFAVGSPHVAGDRVAAIRYTLAVDDIMSALNVLEQMELPMYSIVIDGESSLTITFLTGGSL